MKRRVFILGMMLALCVSSMMVDMVVAESAEAKRVTYVNRYHRQVSVAVRYKTSSGNWITRGWQHIRAFSRRTIGYNSKNTIFYLYAVASDGKRWSGSNRANDRSYHIVENKNFSFIGKDHWTTSKKVRFFEQRFRDNNGVYVFQ